MSTSSSPPPPAPNGTPVQTRGPLLVATSVTLTTFALIALVGRFYSRYRLLRASGSDDWCILAAFICTLTVMTIYLVMVDVAGAGRHTATLEDSQMLLQHKLGNSTRLIYLPTAALIRISVLLFMRRLSPGKIIQISTATIIAMNVVYTIIAIFLLPFQCSPSSTFFTPRPFWKGPQKCVGDSHALEIAIPIISAVMDFLAWLVPVCMVIGLKFMSWRRKVQQSLLLGLGLLACIPSVLRIPAIGDQMKRDPSWYGITLSTWTIVELALGIIAASVPALYPLVIILLRKAGISMNSESQSGSSKVITASKARQQLAMEMGAVNAERSQDEGASEGNNSVDSLYPHTVTVNGKR